MMVRTLEETSTERRKWLAKSGTRYKPVYYSELDNTYLGRCKSCNYGRMFEYVDSIDKDCEGIKYYDVKLTSRQRYTTRCYENKVVAEITDVKWILHRTINQNESSKWETSSSTTLTTKDSNTNTMVNVNVDRFKVSSSVSAAITDMAKVKAHVERERTITETENNVVAYSTQAQNNTVVKETRHVAPVDYMRYVFKPQVTIKTRWHGDSTTDRKHIQLNGPEVITVSVDDPSQILLYNLFQQDVEHCDYENVEVYGEFYALDAAMDKEELEKRCPTTTGYKRSLRSEYFKFVCVDHHWKVKDQCPCAEGYDNNGVVGGECKSACAEQSKFFYDEPTARKVSRLEVGKERELSCPTTTGYGGGSFKVKCLDDKTLVISDDLCECNTTEYYKKFNHKCLKYCDAAKLNVFGSEINIIDDTEDGRTLTRNCPTEQMSGYMGGVFEIQCINTQLMISRVCECSPGYKLIDYKCNKL